MGIYVYVFWTKVLIKLTKYHYQLSYLYSYYYWPWRVFEVFNIKIRANQKHFAGKPI